MCGIQLNHMFKSLRAVYPAVKAVRSLISKPCLPTFPRAELSVIARAPQPPAAKDVVIDLPQLHPSSIKPTLQDVVKQLAACSVNNEPFFLLDIGDVYRKHQQWVDHLPTVEPFYAVKCNSDPLVLQSLASLGTGFDCASLVEMQTMLSLGVDPKKIIFAHPCKPPSHIRFALEHGVEMMTFDNEDELVKVKAIHPDAKYVTFSF